MVLEKPVRQKSSYASQRRSQARRRQQRAGKIDGPMALVDQAHTVHGGRKANHNQDEREQHGPTILR